MTANIVLPALHYFAAFNALVALCLYVYRLGTLAVELGWPERIIRLGLGLLLAALASAGFQLGMRDAPFEARHWFTLVSLLCINAGYVWLFATQRRP